MRDIEVMGQLSCVDHPDILQVVESAVATVPEEIREAMVLLKIRIAHRLIDIDPNQASRVAQGYGGRTIESASALYYGGHLGEIHLAQTQKYDDGAYKAAWNCRYHVALHELGHAADDCLGDEVTDISGSPEFINAYAKDIAAMTMLMGERADYVKRNLRYFFTDCVGHGYRGSQKTEAAARREVFAEGFACMIGGFSSEKSLENAQKHMQTFPNCYRIMAQTILRHAPNAQLFPVAPYMSEAQTLSVRAGRFLQASFAVR